MTEREWLAQLKEGDEVFISQRYNIPPRASVVTRVTATQVIVGIQRFRKKDGISVGGSSCWSWTHLVMPSDSVREQSELYRLKSKAKSLRESLKVPATKDDLIKFIAALSPFVESQQ